eukprot:2672647-Amphidinium_carterae.1
MSTSRRGADSFIARSSIEEEDAGHVIPMLVDEIMAYREAWAANYDDWENANFWQKCSNQTVLAVAAVRGEGDSWKFIRGMNTE